MATTADDDTTKTVKLEFLDGETLQLPFHDENHVQDLINSAKVAKPSTKPGAMLALASPEGHRMDPLQKVTAYGDLTGATLSAVHTQCENAYLVTDGEGGTLMLAEGDHGWEEETGKKANVSMESWVPCPDVREIDGAQVQNLAKESIGVTVSATSNTFDDPQKLNNVLRLGAKFGEPRYIPGGDNSFIFKKGDGDHKLHVDFGKDVVLSRVGSMCYGDRWVDFMEIASSEDADPATAKWVVWGSKRERARWVGTIYFDRSPTRVRLLRFSATSGHVPGARLGPVFAYGVNA